MLLALQGSAGNRAVARAIAVQRTLTNDATWGPVEGTTGQGTSVRAITGPGYTYGSGPKTSPGFRPYDYTAMFSAATTQAFYCQGHLLNDNLGGPGDPAHPNAAQNLTAFPQRPTNSDHKTAIEQAMKSAAKGTWFLYEVSIGYATDSAARLRKRLGGSAGLAVDAGIKTTDTTFTYASSLRATWQELNQSPTSTNAAPEITSGGKSGSLDLAIPSPMTYTKNQAGEYPTYTKVTWGHLPTMKGSHAANRAGTLPTGGSAAFAGRAHLAPVRWGAIDAARTGNPMPTGMSATYQAGFRHYGDGVAASRAGTPVTRYGRGFTTGYQDFEAGIVHGRANLQAAPPASWPASVAGHNEFWAGVILGRTVAFTSPPVGNRAHIAGHADFWAGVAHARLHPKVPAPTNLGQATGHNEYWAGVELGLTTAKSAKPTGNLSSEEGHQAYWEGAEAARADLVAPLATPTTGKSKGHADFVEGVTHARASARGVAPAEGSLARTAACTEYWQGVDFARANPAGTAYAGTSSAARAGAADYRAGADAASTNLSTLTGAPAAAGGGGREGFTDLVAGVTAHQGGAPSDPGRSAQVRGWQDSATGAAAGAVLGTDAARSDGGYISGFLHARGAAQARGGQAAPSPAASPGDAALAGGHAAYAAGLAAARADLSAAPPVAPEQALGHGDYLAGVAHARATARGVAPAAGSAARTQAWTEYWQGVDFARANPAGTAYTGTSSAEAAGAADYRTGTEQAHWDLASLTGPAPAAGGTAEGFADYRTGVEAAQAGTGADATRSAHARGWQDSAAGLLAGAAVAPPRPVRTDGGFMSGFLHAHGAALAQGGQAAPTGGLQQTVAAGGHAGYQAGTAAARADLGSPRPPQTANALGHGDYLAGVALARASARGVAPAAGSAARTTACTEYWQGVDFARANPAGTAYTGTSSAEAAGAADYRTGTEQAHRDLASLTGPPPAAGGAAEGFADYRTGVEAAQAGTGADATRSAQVRGWQDSATGAAAGAVLGTDAARSDGGYISGFLHARGAAQARGGQTGPSPAASPGDAALAGGHAAYAAGLAAARADLGAPPPLAAQQALGHGDYLAGVAHARATARGVAPAAGSAARTQAWTEYWQGVDFARANPAGTAYTGTSSAEAAGAADYRTGLAHAIAHPSGTALASTAPAAAEGAADYWQGEAQAPTTALAPGGPVVAATTAHNDYWSGATHAQASLVNLQGAAPAGRVEALGFAAYQRGAYGADHSQPDIPADLAYTNAWHAYTDAAAHVRAGAVNAARTDSAYLYGVLNTNAPVAKRKTIDPESPNKKRRV